MYRRCPVDLQVYRASLRWGDLKPNGQSDHLVRSYRHCRCYGQIVLACPMVDVAAAAVHCVGWAAPVVVAARCAAWVEPDAAAWGCLDPGDVAG